MEDHEEFVRNLAVKEGLTLVGSTDLAHGEKWFRLMLLNDIVAMAQDLSLIEFYILGYRRGLKAAGRS
jgi:hypothetical protein